MFLLFREYPRNLNEMKGSVYTDNSLYCNLIEVMWTHAVFILENEGMHLV